MKILAQYGKLFLIIGMMIGMIVYMKHRKIERAELKIETLKQLPSKDVNTIDLPKELTPKGYDEVKLDTSTMEVHMIKKMAE